MCVSCAAHNIDVRMKRIYLYRINEHVDESRQHLVVWSLKSVRQRAVHSHTSRVCSVIDICAAPLKHGPNFDAYSDDSLMVMKDIILLELK